MKESLNFPSLTTTSLFQAPILFRALFKYAMQVSLHVKKWRSILKFNLKGPDMILAHNKNTQYA